MPDVQKAVVPIFETLPKNSVSRQAHSQYPRMWLDRYFNIQKVDFDEDSAPFLYGVDCDNYVFVQITVPSGMRAIVTRVAFNISLGSAFTPPITNRLFLRNRQIEPSRFTYDRFTNNVKIGQPPGESDLPAIGGSYPNPDAVDVYDFGNSGDSLTYAINCAPSDSAFKDIPLSPMSWVEADYILLPPNTETYTSAQV